jgi:prolyl 4-hydroxylase
MAGVRTIEQGNALLASGDAEAAIKLITDAASRDDADALNELALWHVYGDPLPRDFVAARIFFGRAGAAGHRAAALTYAVFVAIGAGIESNWAAALDLLDRAAANDPRAARQKSLIAGMALTATGAPPSLPPVVMLSRTPKLAIIRRLLTPDECDHLIQLSLPRLVPSIVIDSVTHRQSPHPVRTSDGTVLGPIQQDLVVEAINRRIAAITGTRVEQGEPIAVMRYAPGQQYRLHHDCLPGDTNQRVMTAITYLNDGYVGGKTAFPGIGCEIQGRKGDVILFSNTLPDGRVDERSRHAGTAVTRGEKWICTRWIRTKDFDPWGMRLT